MTSAPYICHRHTCAHSRRARPSHRVGRRLPKHGGFQVVVVQGKLRTGDPTWRSQGPPYRDLHTDPGCNGSAWTGWVPYRKWPTPKPRSFRKWSTRRTFSLWTHADPLQVKYSYGCSASYLNCTWSTLLPQSYVNDTIYVTAWLSGK